MRRRMLMSLMSHGPGPGPSHLLLRKTMAMTWTETFPLSFPLALSLTWDSPFPSPSRFFSSETNTPPSSRKTQIASSIPFHSHSTSSSSPFLVPTPPSLSPSPHLFPSPWNHFDINLSSPVEFIVNFPSLEELLKEFQSFIEDSRPTPSPSLLISLSFLHSFCQLGGVVSSRFRDDQIYKDIRFHQLVVYIAKSIQTHAKHIVETHKIHREGEHREIPYPPHSVIRSVRLTAKFSLYGYDSHFRHFFHYSSPPSFFHLANLMSEFKLLLPTVSHPPPMQNSIIIIWEIIIHYYVKQFQSASHSLSLWYSPSYLCLSHVFSLLDFFSKFYFPNVLGTPKAKNNPKLINQRIAEGEAAIAMCRKSIQKMIQNAQEGQHTFNGKGKGKREQDEVHETSPSPSPSPFSFSLPFPPCSFEFQSSLSLSGPLIHNNISLRKMYKFLLIIQNEEEIHNNLCKNLRYNTHQMDIKEEIQNILKEKMQLAKWKKIQTQHFEQMNQQGEGGDKDKDKEQENDNGDEEESENENE